MRLTGSADLFQGDGRTPSASINYIASHDGLTLADLAESSPVLADVPPGPERDRARRQLQRNLLATLMLSMGTPMITAGDEWGRSQQGHDNAYDQDNLISWLHWRSADEPLRQFVRHLIHLRPSIPWLERGRWPGEELQLQWLGEDGTPLTKHVITNPIVEVDEAAGTASCRSYYTVFQQTDDFPLQPVIEGRYHDEFERVDGVWRWSYRDYSLVDLVGDMSHHAAQPIPSR